MPHGNRKSHQSNKKKKHKGRQQGAAPSTRAASSPATSYLQDQNGRSPHLEDFQTIQQKLKNDYSDIYSRYKAATKRFTDYMKEKTPSSLVTDGSSVNFLIQAADWMYKTNHTMDVSILRDLKLAIRVRTRVAKSIFGGGDGGHKYFLEVLTFCWTILVKLPRSSSSSSATTTAQQASEQEERRSDNPFQVLEEQDEDDDENDEFLPSGPVPRPTVSEDDDRPVMTLEELENAEDRNDVILFLLTMDEILKLVSDLYQAVAKNMKLYREIPTAIFEEYLEAAIGTNMAIQQVQHLEMQLKAQHEHITTPYRALATLVLPELVRQVAECVREHASKSCLESDIFVFLGDSLECCFRNTSDPMSRRETIVQEFCEEFSVDTEGCEQIKLYFEALKRIVLLEVPIGEEKKNRAMMIETLSSIGESVGALPQSHSWLKMTYIGGDRAIQHTIRLLQTFGQIISSTPHDQGIVAKSPGFFGPSWRAGRARKFHGDMDELLMTDIIPEWVKMFRHGILGTQKLPREDELCPLFVLIRQYVENSDKPVSWSLAFAVHAVLTSIYETQHEWSRLIPVTKGIFNNYHEQLEWAIRIARNEQGGVGDNETWNRNMFTMMFLRNLGLDVFRDTAIWNPLYGGTTLSYLCFFTNLEGGCAMIDCLGQLRIVLFLYHGLLVCGILRPGQLPLLDMLYQGFRTCKGVWEGQLPKRGELVQRWWICYGASIPQAKKMAEDSKKTTRQRQIGDLDVSGQHRRRMTPIEPSDISVVFRRICCRDYSDVVDHYHTPEQRRRNQYTDQYRMAVRINDTLDTLDKEQKLLALNLINCGTVLDQFVCSLGRILQWEPILAQGMASSAVLSRTKRDGFVYLFAQHLLGALDFADDPFRHEFLNVPLGEATATFMSLFFGELAPERVLWFTPVEEESGQQR